MKQIGLALVLSFALGPTLLPAEAASAESRHVIHGDVHVGVEPGRVQIFTGHEQNFFRPDPFFRHKFKIHQFGVPGHFGHPGFPHRFGPHRFFRPKFGPTFVPGIPPSRPLWVPGLWVWNGFGWIWVPGHWVR